MLQWIVMLLTADNAENLQTDKTDHHEITATDGPRDWDGDTRPQSDLQIFFASVLTINLVITTHLFNYKPLWECGINKS